MVTETRAYSRQASYENYSIEMDKVYYHRLIDEVERFSVNAPERKLLDIGCFDGMFASQFLASWEVYGIEGNVRACQKANERGVKTSNHDLDKGLPFPDEMFDCVIAAEIIEHVYDTDFFLREINRVLKNKGVLVMSVPNIACLTNRVKLLFGLYPRYAEYKAGGAGHIRIYTAQAIKEQVTQNGFKVLRFVGCNLPLPMHKKWVPDWLKKIAVRGGDYFPGIAGQVILTAEK